MSIRTDSAKNLMVQTLLDLQSLDSSFCLTGSHFFCNKPTSKSDIDFFAAESSEVKAELHLLGFKQNVPEHQDGIVTDIYRHPSGIDIRLVNNLPIMQEAQKLLREVNYFDYIYLPEDKFKAWELALTAAKILITKIQL